VREYWESTSTEARIINLESTRQNFLCGTCKLHLNYSVTSFLNCMLFLMVFIPCSDHDKSLIITQQMHILCMYTVTL